MAAHSSHELDPYDDIHHHDLLIYKRGCCLWMPCHLGRGVRPSSDGWHRLPTLTAERKHYCSWWIRGLKRIRELSEIVAGRKCKTFVRRLNRSKIAGNGKYRELFQYDPCSYSLNFDEGPGHNGDLEEDDYLHRAFSSRYAAAIPK